VLGCVHHLRGSFSEETKGACSGRLFARGEGAPKRRCAPHLGGGRTLRERAQASREKARVFQAFKWVKNHGILVLKASTKQRIMIKTKASKRKKVHQGKGRLTSQGLWESIRGTPRHQRVVAIGPGSLVYVSCVVHFALRPSIYICSKLVFPMGGGGFQGHVGQKSMCQIYACLEVYISILKFKI
jgi:hypothetical protein